MQGLDILSQTGLIDWLESPLPHARVLQEGEGHRRSDRGGLRDRRRRDSFPFETDGAVLKVDDYTLQQQLGAKTREPRWAIAYKFQAHQAITRIIDIRGASAGRASSRRYAVLEPVRIGGVTVSRSTLHNWDELGAKDIRVGDTVVIERAAKTTSRVGYTT